MARIIKKGRCEYQTVCVPPVPEPESSDENAEQEAERRFDSLSAVIDSGPVATQGEHGAPQEEPTDAGEKILSSVQEEAEEIIRKARASAETIREEARQALRDAQKKGEEIESQAYAAGFEQGKKDGEEIGRKQYLVVAQRLEKLINRISEGAEALLPQYEAQMVEVAMSVARQVIGREIELSPEIVMESIRAAMELVVEGCAVHLHLNPEDIDALEESIREKFVVPGRQGLDIIHDPRIDRGGCLIETEYGLIDATTKAKWQAVSDTVKRILAERTGTAAYSGSAKEDVDNLPETESVQAVEGEPAQDDAGDLPSGIGQEGDTQGT